MEKKGISLVGWYHSHPKSQPDPSLRDIESQMEYQLLLRGPGSTYHPCVGVIVGKTKACHYFSFKNFKLLNFNTLNMKTVMESQLSCTTLYLYER